MLNMKFHALLAIGALVCGSSTAGISRGAFEIRKGVVAGGGGVSSGAGIVLTGTIGQPLVEHSVGGQFQLSGGFWTREPQRPDLIFGDSYEG